MTNNKITQRKKGKIEKINTFLKQGLLTGQVSPTHFGFIFRTGGTYKEHAFETLHKFSKRLRTLYANQTGKKNSSIPFGVYILENRYVKNDADLIRVLYTDILGKVENYMTNLVSGYTDIKGTTKFDTGTSVNNIISGLKFSLVDPTKFVDKFLQQALFLIQQELQGFYTKFAQQLQQTSNEFQSLQQLQDLNLQQLNPIYLSKDDIAYLGQLLTSNIKVVYNNNQPIIRWGNISQQLVSFINKKIQDSYLVANKYLQTVNNTIQQYKQMTLQITTLQNTIKNSYDRLLASMVENIKIGLQNIANNLKAEIENDRVRFKQDLVSRLDKELNKYQTNTVQQEQAIMDFYNQITSFLKKEQDFSNIKYIVYLERKKYEFYLKIFNIETYKSFVLLTFHVKGIIKIPVGRDLKINKLSLNNSNIGFSKMFRPKGTIGYVQHSLYQIIDEGLANRDLQIRFATLKLKVKSWWMKRLVYDYIMTGKKKLQTKTYNGHTFFRLYTSSNKEKFLKISLPPTEQVYNIHNFFEKFSTILSLSS